MRCRRAFVHAIAVGAIGIGIGCNALTGVGDLAVCADCGDAGPAPASGSSSGTTSVETSASSGASSTSSTSSSTSSTSSSTSSTSSTSSSTTSGSGATGCPKPEPGLLAYYPLDESNGATTVSDCSGNGHDGTVISPGTWGAGKFGGAFTTSDAAGCIDLGTPQALLLEGSSFTVAAWANAQAFGTTELSYYILGRTALPQAGGWRVGTDPGAWTAKLFDTQQQQQLIVTSATGQATGVWTHIAATFSPGAQVVLYVNGAAVDSVPYSAITPDNTATVRIGCRGDGQGFFHGSIDEVRIYSGAASADTLAALAARTP